MPANEQTWRNIPLLHRVFAVAGVCLLITTLWVLASDHQREWKKTQIQVVDIDTTMNRWRQQQYQTDQMTAQHESTAYALLTARAASLDNSYLDRFAAIIKKFDAELAAIKDNEPLPFDYDKLAAERDTQAKLAETAEKDAQIAQESKVSAAKAMDEYQQFRSAAKKDDDEKVRSLHKEADAAQAKAADSQAQAESSLAAAGAARDKFVKSLSAIADQLRNREDIVLGLRKFQSAKLDAAKANVDIAVRDNFDAAKMKEVQDKVDRETEAFKALNLRYQVRNVARVQLQTVITEITAEETNALKAQEAALAELGRLQQQFTERQQTYFVNQFPFLGKKILTLPILNAFGSPLKVENLWSEGLLQDVNFKKVRRFDRCTTCHQLLQRSMPNAPTDPAYIKEEVLEAWLTPPAAVAEGLAENASTSERLEKTFGLRLANQGLLNFDDVTVSLVLPNSAVAKAEVVTHADPHPMATSVELQNELATFTPSDKVTDFKILPGLVPGDVIVGVGDDKILSAERVGALLLDSVGSKEPLKILIRRGLPNPFLTHPRLDLFVSDASPHNMGTFGCTICHEGQGNGTAFKWTSHTPNDDATEPDESVRWAKEYGWFDNHHWIYPMFPKRFAESGCLKCHHEVTELERSERFPEPPAPKLTHGYHLIRKYGCYGCHEVNGYDGPNKRIGPDLRIEPNYFAVGLQMGHLLPQRLSELKEQLAKAEEEQKEMLTARIRSAERALELAVRIGQKNYDDAARSELQLIFSQDQSLSADRAFTPALDELVGMLKDAEAPGDLRKPGPSLRFSKDKLDAAFVYDWTENPKRFRPTTRMPQFFGLWDHLQEDQGALHTAQKLEPVELHGIVAYLAANSQTFVPVQKPSGIKPVDDEEAQIERGKQLFETRGCLACHEHQDFQTDVENDDDSVFPAAHRFRGESEIVQGPDLSRLPAKFDPQRNPKGREWLYSWIKEPTRYHARTVMPNLYLDPIPQKGADGKVEYTDPVDDIVAYLLNKEHLKSAGDWQPVGAATTKVDDEALRTLTIEYLRESFPERKLEDYYNSGIPESLRSTLKVAERDLIVPEGGQLSDEQRLRYIGRRTIAKYGCFGCHDIPGFEDAKPIGTGLADWGRKDPSKLAFEHITHYLEHGHGHATHHAKDDHDDHKHEADHAPVKASPDEELPVFYERAMHHQHRSAFIYQKLKEPRSYDYKKVDNKKYNDRLRMPQFPFSPEQREAVITFVLGLVADPPTEKYLYKPNPRQAAILAGKQVLETYNCGGCHVLQGEKWKLSFTPDTFEEQSAAKTYPYMLHQFDPNVLAKSATPDARGNVSATIHGLPATVAASGLAMVLDEEDGELEADTPYAKKSVKFGFDLYAPTVLGGNPFQTGPQPIRVPAAAVNARYATEGGFLTKYLLPIVTQRLAKTAGTGKGREAFGWLPPPLIGEGAKVQSAWLHDFLLEPYPIRPAVVLRMPKFNLSSEDATKLVNYFAAVDNAQYPYELEENRLSDHLAAKQAKYEQTLAAKGSSKRDRLDDAMQIVVNGNFCVKCHLVGEFQPEGADQAKGPNLARVYERLRPDYVRRWIAKPTMILPYTSMPENIPYDPAKEHLGGVDQNLFHGTSVEQVDGLVDLLMNYDEFAKRKTLVTPLIPKAATAATENVKPAN